MGVPVVLRACAVLLISACGGSETVLTVDLQTDLISPTDFVGTEVSVVGSDAAPQERLAFRQAPGDSLRIARFSDLEPGPAEVVVQLFAPNGRLVFRRSVLVDVEGRMGTTIVASRSCIGVACGLGEACYGGQCVDAECTIENPEACGEPMCMSDEECMASTCGSARCSGGICLGNLAGMCEPDELCHPMSGCVPVTSGANATLTVVVEGEGSVTSELGDCSDECDFEVPLGAEVRLQAVEGDAKLWAWLNPQALFCEPRSTECAFVMDQTRTVRALFRTSTHELVTVTPVLESGEPANLRFNDLAASPSGELYATDIFNDMIWHVAPDGVARRVAGSVAGYDDGPGDVARFADPSSLVFDAAGVLYLADRANNRIRAIAPDGMVSTLAGTATPAAPTGLTSTRRSTIRRTSRTTRRARRSSSPMSPASYACSTMEW